MADKVVVDGELSMDTIIDGDLQLESQVEGETESVIKIEPKLEPITVSKNGVFLPSEGMDGFSSVTVDADIEDDYEWRKPEDWPDLESVKLPDRWDLDTIYFLFDRSCGIDEVGFVGGRFRVYKGTVENGEFIGDIVANNVGSFDDTLTEQYTVYKIEQTSRNNTVLFSRNFMVGTNYAWMDIGCVWIYGEVPLHSNLGGTSGQSVLTPYMRRMVYRHVQNNSFTFPENLSRGAGFDISVSFLCASGNVYGDWNGIALRRTGNGPVTPPIKQKSDYVVKNVTFNNQYTRGAITARNVVLINPHGTLFNGQYQYDGFIEKFIVKGGDLICRNMLYQFYLAQHLKICELHDVDFSECTSSGSAFSNCYSLERLTLNDTWSLDLYMGESPNFRYDALIDIFDVLPVVSNGQKITLSRRTYALLTAEDIEIATNKGWTVRSV